MAVDLDPEEEQAVVERLRRTREERSAEGIGAFMWVPCDVCLRTKSLVGFFLYEAMHLCYECALAYELARARGEANSLGEFLDRYDATLLPLG